MNRKNISPFRPKKLIKYKPKNIKIYTFNSGFKKKNDDLLIIVFKKLVPFSAIFTKSSTPAATIKWNKKNYNNLCKVLIVNSGNANSFTGKKGISNIHKYVKYASNYFSCNSNQIFVSSTGVIGEQLDPKKIIKKIPEIKKSRSKDILQAAKAIMTTDTFPKTASETFKFKNKIYRIFGIAKGSGMIFPNMGTMLSYIFTDAYLNKKELYKILKENAEETFNSITVDSDTSTNDTVAIFSLGEKKSKTEIQFNKKFFNLFTNSINKLMTNLATQVVSDGEGISKLIEIKVTNSKTKKQAKKIAFSIANSPLVKTAMFGQDANWGRIIMALGKDGEKINQEKLILKIGNMIVAKNGMMYEKINLRNLNKYMKRKKIIIEVNLNLGKEFKKVWTSDLSHKYIEINADYRS